MKRIIDDTLLTYDVAELRAIKAELLQEKEKELQAMRNSYNKKLDSLEYYIHLKEKLNKRNEKISKKYAKPKQNSLVDISKHESLKNEQPLLTNPCIVHAPDNSIDNTQNVSINNVQNTNSTEEQPKKKLWGFCSR